MGIDVEAGTLLDPERKQQERLIGTYGVTKHDVSQLPKFWADLDKLETEAELEEGEAGE